MSKLIQCGTFLRLLSKVWSNVLTKERMRLLDFMLVRQLRTSLHSQLVPGATLLPWRLQPYFSIFTILSKMIALELQQLFRCLIFVNWIQLCSQRFLSQLHANNFLRLYLMEAREFNKLSWPWWILLLFSHIQSLMTHFKKMIRSNQQSANF